MAYLAAAMLLVLASSGWTNAHHLQTAPVVQFTAEDSGPLGEALLSRASASAGAFAALIVTPGPGGVTQSKIVRYRLLGAFANTVIADGTDGLGKQTPGAFFDSPAISFFGQHVAYVTENATGGNRQVYVHSGGLRSDVVLVSNDPTGTSANPVVSGNGRVVAFESRGDLALTGNSGAQQIFASDEGQPLLQVSLGSGRSGNASLDRWGKRIAFESTSDPTTGLDTGIPQVWQANLMTGEVGQITIGQGASGKPTVSSEGHLVVFESTADLAGTGAETGVPQIYAHDLRSGTSARITNDATGCIDPSVRPFRTDWRIAFMCAGQPYFYMLRADQRYRVQADGGHTTRILAGIAPQFILLSTTAPIVPGSQPSATHQVYLVNLFKRPAEPVDGLAVWFPTRGLSPLR